MKRFRSWLIAGSAILALLIAGSGVAVAANRHRDVRLDAGQTANGFFIRAGQAITIDGTVNGDVIVAGSSVAIDGTVNGNVYAAAQSITVRGTVTGNLHAAGSTVELDGNVHGSTYLAGATVRTAKAASVDGGAMAAGSNVVLDGKIGKQLYAAGSAISLNNSVGGNTTLAGTQITLDRDAAITGNLTYYSANSAQIDNDTKISGNISHQQPRARKHGFSFGAALARAIYLTVAWFLLGLVLLALWPRTIVEVAALVQRRPLRSVLLGLAVLVGVPLAALIIAISFVGIPLAIALGLVYIVALMLADSFVALWFGRLILSYHGDSLPHNLGALALGLVILELVQLLPYVGGLIGAVAFLFGLGALAGAIYDHFAHTRPSVSGTKPAR